MIEILWWHWLAAGLAVLAIDLMLINTYYLLWLGLGALLVGIFKYFIPELSVVGQIGSWGGISILLIVLWVRLRKKFTGLTRSGEILDVGGVIVEWHKGRGRIRFQRPYGDSDVWNANSTEKFKIGDNAKVAEVDLKQQTVTLTAR